MATTISTDNELLLKCLLELQADNPSKTMELASWQRNCWCMQRNTNCRNWNTRRMQQNNEMLTTIGLPMWVQSLTCSHRLARFWKMIKYSLIWIQHHVMATRPYFYWYLPKWTCTSELWFIHTKGLVTELSSWSKPNVPTLLMWICTTFTRPVLALIYSRRRALLTSCNDSILATNKPSLLTTFTLRQN
jgi:hypothetical protein